MHQFFFSEGDGVGGVGLQYTDRRLYGDQAGFFLSYTFINSLSSTHRFFFIRLYKTTVCDYVRVMI